MERRDLEVGDLEVGQSVLFMDSSRCLKPALVTAVHGDICYDESGKQIWLPCINLITCSSNVSKNDDYGRQVERHSSVSHRSSNVHHEQATGNPIGMTWQFFDDVF